MEVYLQKLIKNKKKGFGLVEALIALILVASTMILAMRTVSVALKTTKDNEVRDTAAGIMLRALEYNQADLPADVLSAEDNFASMPRSICYRLDEDNSLVLVSGSCSGLDDSLITTCNSSSNYITNTPGVNVCNQIVFTNIRAGAVLPTDYMSSRIRITSVVVYYVDNASEPEIKRVDTYRQLPF